MDLASLPKTRSQAKAVGAKYYFTGEPCKHGHIAPRKTKGACVDCLRVEWEESSTKRIEYFRSYAQSDAGRAAKKRYYEANKTVIIEKALNRSRDDKQKYRKKWAEENVVIVRASTKARRRKHRLATPDWLTTEQFKQIRDIYERAISISKLTGIPHAVDHIIPLVHQDVCGLHVPWNLQILTREANATKSNVLPSEKLWLAWPGGA
jgi:5-methylcytosine-specific restriction endonuclease McrA